MVQEGVRPMVTSAAQERAWWNAVVADPERLRENVWGGDDPDWGIAACTAAIVPDLAQGAEPHGRILDLGCGPGRLTLPIAQRWAGTFVMGVDCSPRMVAQARMVAARAGAHNVEFVFCDGRHLPDMGTFNAAFCVAVFQHIPPEAVRGYVGQVAERLAPGGAFRFQYVEADDDVPDGFLHYRFHYGDVLGWLGETGLERVRTDWGLLYPEWTWITARKP